MPSLEYTTYDQPFFWISAELNDVIMVKWPVLVKSFSSEEKNEKNINVNLIYSGHALNSTSTKIS